ncbi:hypothetical protein M3Y94_00691300 [Aphelenchoides besseyi]|nr:hypothetical protein M3Y94_00691300 [Aphelenchoides besseyi]
MEPLKSVRAFRARRRLMLATAWSGSGKLKVDGDELNFKVLYNKNGPGEPKKITLTVGKCLMTFDISGRTTEKAFLTFAGPYSTPFPVPIKLDADGYTVGAKLFQCADYNPSSTEKVVEFNFTSEKTFPGLEIEFENAIVYEVPESESEWSLKSWRFWLSISAGIASFILLLSAISGCIWCSVKLKDDKKKNKKKSFGPWQCCSGEGFKEETASESQSIYYSWWHSIGSEEQSCASKQVATYHHCKTTHQSERQANRGRSPRDYQRRVQGSECSTGQSRQKAERRSESAEAGRDRTSECCACSRART